MPKRYPPWADCIARLSLTPKRSHPAALSEIALAPIVRHPLAGLLAGAWAERNQLRLVDALYVELATRLRATLLTTDGRLARARPDIELIT